MCEKIATNGEMRAADKEADNMYSYHLKQWTSFLESKAFKELSKKKRSSADKPKATDTAEPAKPLASPFREETEGERKHIVKETELIGKHLNTKNLLIGLSQQQMRQMTLL